MGRITAPTLAATAFAVAASVLCAAPANASQIDRIAPSAVERGGIVTLIGDFGVQSGSDVAIVRIVNGQILGEGQPMEVMVWSASRIKAIVPQNLEPAEGYGVVMRSSDRGYSNVVGLNVLSTSLPRWSLRPGEVIKNRCDSSIPRQNGVPVRPCPTLGYIGSVDTRHAFPGGRLLLDGDFSNMAQGQVVALVRTDVVYTQEIGRSIRREIAQHLLPVAWTSPNRIEVSVGNDVYPGTFMLMLVNPLSEFDTGQAGLFERGSNSWDVAIRNVWP